MCSQGLMLRGEAELADPFAKQLVLGLGLLFLGNQGAVEATIEVWPISTLVLMPILRSAELCMVGEMQQSRDVCERAWHALHGQEGWRDDQD